MESFGGTPQGARLARMKASARWAGERFRNVRISLRRERRVPLLGQCPDEINERGEWGGQEAPP